MKTVESERTTIVLQVTRPDALLCLLLTEYLIKRVKGNTYILVSGVGVTVRLKAKTDGSTRLGYTGLSGGLGHLKIETRLRGERFESVMGVLEA